VSETKAPRRNIAQYFVESRQVAWVLLVVTLVVGIFAYTRMPKRKDPFLKVRAAVAVCPWPGASPEKVEQMLTRKVEEAMAQNPDVEKIESSSRTGVSIVTVTLRDEVATDQIAKVFDDIDLKLRSLKDLPAGASPIDFQKDFGDTAALMLTVASPKVRQIELSLRATAIRKALTAERSSMPGDRYALVLSFPGSLNAEPLRRTGTLFTRFALASGAVHQARLVEGPAFIAVDGYVDGGAEVWPALLARFLKEEQSARFHPDIWRPMVVGHLDALDKELEASAGEAYSARELDDVTQTIATRLRAVPTVAKVTRSGVLGERIYLDYSQERFAALEVGQQTLRDAITARNVSTPSGAVEADGRSVTIQSSGEYATERDVGDTLITTTANGAPVYVRDVVDVIRDYEPPLYQNYYTGRDASGQWIRTRAVTLAIQMKSGEQIARFSDDVDASLATIRQTLPEDLIFARTSDQPKQVEEKVGLFMRTLYEAIAIIILVALVGFGEWRSALLLGLAIPLTLAMTFLFMWILRIDLQQISIAALILALGLLVDDPVVAGDAIKHELDTGQPRIVAAWLGPTKLGRAILYATITNIVAYLPFLLLTGDVGNFMYSLPIVLACSLVASRIVSMTFIPLLGYTLLRPRKKKATSRFMTHYQHLVVWSLEHRKLVLLLSTVVLFAGGFAARGLKSSFFPKDHSHLFYVDAYLPEDATIRATADVAQEADEVIREVAETWGAQHGVHAPVLHSVTSFVGGSAPRFWYSLSPQQRQLNYAQLVVEVVDDHETSNLIAPLQAALTARIAGARLDVRQLENGKPVPRPVEVRFAGDDPNTLRDLGRRAKDVLRAVPLADGVRDDWGQNSFRLQVDVDPAKASLAGVTNADVSNAAAAGFMGVPMSVLREGDKQIPIVARLRADERGNASALEDLYVLAPKGVKLPLSQVARVSLSYEPERIQRRNQLRTISVFCFPTPGSLPSEVMNGARAGLEALRGTLPPGYTMEIGGSEENVIKVRKESAVIAIVSMFGILIALVLQFRHALKPLIVFATLPYGVAGAIVAIVIMRAPFGFTAILGVISLIGVIVSHVIVKFELVERAREEGEQLRPALINAGTQRMRPVLITVGATVLGLLPLALHGGPLWEPLCYAQIGGLTVATGITLLLVPVLYAIVILDLKWIRWDAKEAKSAAEWMVEVTRTFVMPKAQPAIPSVGREPQPSERTIVKAPAFDDDDEATHVGRSK
jgi:multidrug efflux pump subunit AcrB